MGGTSLGGGESSVTKISMFLFKEMFYANACFMSIKHVKVTVAA